MPTITLRLTLDVTYDTDNPDVEDFLCDRLRQIPSIAADDGLLSGNCDAFVDTWTARVERFDG